MVGLDSRRLEWRLKAGWNELLGGETCGLATNGNSTLRCGALHQVNASRKEQEGIIVCYVMRITILGLDVSSES